MTDVPIDIKISSEGAESGSRRVTRSLDEIKAKAKETKTATKEVSDSLKTLDSAAQGTEVAAKKTARSLEDIRDKAKGAKQATDGVSESLKNVKTAQDNTSESSKKLARSIDDVRDKAGKSRSTTDSARDSLKQFDGVARNVTDRLKQLAGAFGIYLGARELIQSLDTFQTLQNRIKVATDGIGDFNTAFDRLAEISDKTRTPLAANVELFQRISIASKELGASQNDLFQFVENVGKALAIQGGSSQAAAGALLQLSQALGGAVIQAQEFNSIIDGAFPIVQAAAKGIDAAGGSVSKLRQLVIQGKVTNDEFFKAILSQSQELEHTFGATASTLSQGLTVFNNKWLEYIDNTPAIKQATAGTSDAIIFLANNLDTAINLIIAISGALAVRYVVAQAAATVATLTLSGAVATLGTVLKVAFPIAAIAAAIFAVIEYFNEFEAALTLITAGTIINFSNMKAYIVGTLTGIVAALKNTDEVIGGFLLDLKEFATNPLGDNAGFDNFKAALTSGYSDAFNSAYSAAKQEADEFNQAILEETKTKLNELLGAGKAAGKGIGDGMGAAKAATAEAGKEVKRLIETLKDTIATERIHDMERGLNEMQKAALGVDLIVLKAVGSFQKLNPEAERLYQQARKLATQNVALDELRQLYEDTLTPLEQYTKGVEHLAELRPFVKSSEDLQGLDRSLQKLKDDLNPLAEVFKDTAVQIKDAFADTFESLFRGQLNSFKDFSTKIKDIFIKMLAQLATIAIAKPIIVPVIQSVGGVIGLDNSSIKAVTDQLGGSGAGGALSGAGGISQLFGAGGGLLSGAKDLFNSIGSSVFGTSAGIGPLQPGAQAGTLSDILGNTFSGSYGGFFANLLGLGSGNALVDTGTSLAGAAIGNLIAPGIGGVIGSFAGTALGGLLGGGGRPHPASNAGSGGFDAAGQLVNVELSSKHADTKAASDLVTAVNTIGAIFAGSGIDLSGIKSVQTGVDDGRGFFSLGDFKADRNNPSAVVNFAANDQKAGEAALGRFAKLLATRIDEITDQIDDKTLGVINSIQTEGRKAEDITKDLQFALNFESLFKTVEPITQASAALQAVNDNFDSMATTMKGLAYTAGDLNRLEGLRNDTLKKTKDAIYQTSVDAFLQETNPAALQFGATYKSYQNSVKEFQSVGLDTTFLDRTFQIQQEKLLQQIVKDGFADRIQKLTDEQESASRLVDTYTSLSKSLGDAILGLRLSDTAPLTLDQRVSEARSNFNLVAAKAALGDTDAASQLSSLGNQFLSLSRQQNASTDAFVTDFQSVEAALQKAKETADRQLSIQSQIAQSAKDQIAAIGASTAAIVDALKTTAKTASIINPSVAVSANNANETLVAGIRSGSISQSQVAQALGIFGSLGVPAADGQGGRSAFFEANPAANAAFIAAARQLGIPGFDRGGDVLGNSVFMVGERQPELYRSGAGGGRVIPIENGMQVEQRLAAMERHQMATNQILMAGFNRLVEAQRKQLTSMEKNTRAVNRAG